MSPLRNILNISVASALAFGQAGQPNPNQTQQQGTQQGKQQGTQQQKSQGSTNSTNAGNKESGSNSGALNAADRGFIQQKVQGGRTEIALGRLAQERASDPEVKAFGQMLIADHTKVNNELEMLAQQKRLNLPRERTDLKHTQLSKLTSDQFDRRYMTMMVEDHQKGVADYERMSKSAADPDVKSFAARTLPTLRMHLDHAKSLRNASNSSRDRTGSVNSTGGTGSNTSKTKSNTSSNGNNDARDNSGSKDTNK